MDGSNELPVTLTGGADYIEVKEVILYTSARTLVFTLPDLPNPPVASRVKCARTDDSCKLYAGLQTAVADTSDGLGVVNSVLSQNYLIN